MTAIDGRGGDRAGAPGAVAASCTHRGFDVHGDGSGAEIIVQVNGALDAMIARILQRTLDRIDLTHPSCIVLDVGSLHIIDSAGLELVQSLQARCFAAGRELHINPALSAVHHLFQRQQL